MQAENIIFDIKTVSFGCRLNALESEKIQKMLQGRINTAVVVNTCAVTAEAERQSAQAVRKIARKNPNTAIFVTGCAATRNPTLFASIPNVTVIPNNKKMDIDAYVLGAGAMANGAKIVGVARADTKLSKKYIQIQNGCNHKCAYCVTRLLRGTGVSFDYADIRADAVDAVRDGFGEIVLTGVDIASYARDGRLISDVCRDLLRDVPGIQRLRLSSMDPASPEVFKIIDMMKSDPRMMPHMHLSMQSVSDTVLHSMGRRHSAAMAARIAAYAGADITFSWDIICGFPGESDELFSQTQNMARKLHPIRIHAFPFSPRPDTVAADMPGQIDRCVSKSRVHEITTIADDNRREFMARHIGKTVQVLMEENNIARDVHDIGVKIVGDKIPARTICDVKIIAIEDGMFVGEKI